MTLTWPHAALVGGNHHSSVGICSALGSANDISTANGTRVLFFARKVPHCPFSGMHFWLSPPHFSDRRSICSHAPHQSTHLLPHPAPRPHTPWKGWKSKRIYLCFQLSKCNPVEEPIHQHLMNNTSLSFRSSCRWISCSHLGQVDSLITSELWAFCHFPKHLPSLTFKNNFSVLHLVDTTLVSEATASWDEERGM